MTGSVVDGVVTKIIKIIDENEEDTNARMAGVIALGNILGNFSVTPSPRLSTSTFMDTYCTLSPTVMKESKNYQAVSRAVQRMNKCLDDDGDAKVSR